jgi:hypothetical protein
MVKNKENNKSLFIILGIIVLLFILWWFCIILVPMFPNNNCNTTSSCNGGSSDVSGGGYCPVCTCGEPTCEEGYKYSSERGVCEEETSENTTTLDRGCCPETYLWNPITRSCDYERGGTSTICPSGAYYDTMTNTCDCMIGASMVIQNSITGCCETPR